MLRPRLLVCRVTASWGRRVVYDLADLDRWVEERKRRFTGESTDA